jgi:hypothetical protein
LSIEKKHRKKQMSKMDQDEQEIEQIQDQEENLNHLGDKKKSNSKHVVSHNKRDKVEEVFN